MFVILTRAGDLDSYCIAWALEQLGCDARVLSYGALRPNISKLSARLVDQEVLLRWGSYEFSEGDIQAIWLRKPPNPIMYLSEPILPSPCDFESGNFDETLNLHLNSAVHSISSLGPVINHPQNSIIANNKLYQLQKCNSIHLRKPKTYIGSEKSSIVEFFERHEKIIYKPLRHNVWVSNGVARACKTTVTSKQELQSTLDGDFLPGVFQELIEKEIEYRVIILGSEVICIEKRPFTGSHHDIDWRFSDESNFRSNHVKLPPEIVKACLCIVQSLGLDHASIDLAIDENGNYIFFEANPFGQYMVYEKTFPKTRLLEKSTKLMLSKAGVNYKNFDFSEISTTNFISNFQNEIMEPSINNGDHVYDIVSRQTVSLTTAS